VYRNKGENDRAIQDFNEAIRLNPNYAQAYNNRGIAYFDKRENDRAIQDFNEAIRLDPNAFEAYGNRGYAYRNKGDNDRAIQDFNEVIRLNPNLTVAYINRGIAYRNKQEYDRAIQDFNEAIRLNPNRAQGYRSRGNAAFDLGQYSSAQGDFKRSWNLEPTDPYVAIWVYLAGARAGQEERQELAKNAEKLKHQRLTEKIISLYLGKLSPADLLAAAKDSDAKKQSENLCEVNFYLGQYSLLRGERTDALKFFRAAVETGVTDFVEYAGSKAELSRLEK
jgi:lipoprotein NlpI